MGELAVLGVDNESGGFDVGAVVLLPIVLMTVAQFVGLVLEQQEGGLVVEFQPLAEILLCLLQGYILLAQIDTEVFS